MKPPIKIAVLCNNRMAVPAIQALQASGNLCGIGVPEHNQDVLPMLQDFARQARTVFTVFEKPTLAERLTEWITQTGADAVFMMTFPWRIPTDVLNAFPDKLYNFHYGLLPEMRGADPVFESIRQQKTESGISVHRVDEGIDTGTVVFRHAIPLQADITHGLLCTQLSYLGAQMAPAMVQMLQAGQGFQPQANGAEARYFRKAGLGEVCINWETQTASDVHALVRACNPWNKGAYTQWNGWNMRIVNTRVVDAASETETKPGTILLADAQKGIHVACKNNTQLHIEYIYTDEGFMPAHKLLAFGMKQHDKFSIF